MKSQPITYILWLFFGLFGFHKLYLGNKYAFFLYALTNTMTLISFVWFLFEPNAYLFLWLLGLSLISCLVAISWLIDFFVIPKEVEAVNTSGAVKNYGSFFQFMENMITKCTTKALEIFNDLHTPF